MIRLLIDGHNLIGQMPDISLKDFDDEEKLVVALRKYAARRQAEIVVVFDSGLPGGKSLALSGGNVTTVFAGSHTNADRILIERIRELRQPQQWALVSSDHTIQHEAERRRMRTIESAEFAGRLTSSPPKPDAPRPGGDDKPDREVDVSEWIKVFKSRKK